MLRSYLKHSGKYVLVTIVQEYFIDWALEAYVGYDNSVQQKKSYTI